MRGHPGGALYGVDLGGPLGYRRFFEEQRRNPLKSNRRAYVDDG